MSIKLRKQFENISEIKEMLLNNDELKWCDESKRYINSRVFQDAETGYINGALFGWLASSNRGGYKLVPVEPTQKMIDEFPEVHYQDTYAGDCSLWVEDEIIKLGYKAMIGAVE